MAHQDFERYADEKRFIQGVNSPWSDAFIDFARLTEKQLKDFRFLDYGCGDGKYFQHLRDLGLQTEYIHGVELSRKRVERCHNIGFSHAIHLQKDDKLPYPDQFFDVINLMEVIEHIPRSRAVETLTEIRRVLAPKGILLISTPNYPIKRLYDVFDAILHRKWSRLHDDPTHISPYSYWRIRTLLESIFVTVADHPYKSGFLYRRFEHPVFLHKAFFVCYGKLIPAC
jgi:SAM-dependent methyltransferase